MSSPTPSRFVPGLILGALSLLSAFLLFQVQPIISKFILPWFGGSPGVWTTCMLFFQIVLFAGYAYAHALTLLPRKWQGILHGLLLGAAIAMLPIAPGEVWKPTGMEDPALRILLLLAASVGLPYFVLSSTSPLVQVWFTRASGGGSPWRLYALSNIGSLAALLSYPLFFEVRWDVVEQTTLWAVGFGAFVVLSLSGIWLDRHQAIAAAAKPAEVIDTAADHPGWLRRCLWVLLPALASSVLLAATNHVCQDVAVIPFLWALGWWFGVGLWEIDRSVPDALQTAMARLSSGLRINTANPHTSDGHTGRVIISLTAVADERDNGQYQCDGQDRDRNTAQNWNGTTVPHTASENMTNITKKYNTLIFDVCARIISRNLYTITRTGPCYVHF